MGLVPRGETWRHLGPEMGEGVQERSQEGGKPGEIHGECSGGVTRPEAEHDRTGIRWLWQPVTSPSAVWGRWPCGFLGVCSDVDQVSGERKGPVRACHDPPSPTEESGVAGDPGGGLCVAPSRAQAGRSVGRGRRLATCAFETCGARRHGGAGGGDPVLWEAPGQICLHWPGTFLKMHLFLRGKGSRDQNEALWLSSKPHDLPVTLLEI